MMDEKVVKGCVLGCFGSLALVLGTVFGLVFLVGSLARGCMEDGGAETLAGLGMKDDKPEEATKPTLIWKSGDGDDAAPKIVRLALKGILMDNDGEYAGLLDEEDGTSASVVLKRIRALTKDERIRGLWLDINSPGGGVTISDEIAAALRKFRAAGTNRFVFAYMGDTCCSGGYYIASQADCIMARPTTLTGSIGVIINGINVAELARKAGVKGVTVASAGNKDLLNPLKDVNPEHVKILERPVMAYYERFLEVVATGRKLPVDAIRVLADGRVYTAGDAQKNRLLDEIGYEEDAQATLRKMAGGDVRIYGYEEELTLRQLFSAVPIFKGMTRVAVKEGLKVASESAVLKAEYR